MSPRDAGDIERELDQDAASETASAPAAMTSSSLPQKQQVQEQQQQQPAREAPSRKLMYKGQPFNSDAQPSDQQQAATDDPTAGCCGYGPSGRSPAPRHADLPSAAGAAASALHKLAASHAAASPETATSLASAAQQITSVFGGSAAATKDRNKVQDAAPPVTETASDHLAAVPSAQLDLRPHAGRRRAPTAAAGAGAQRLVAAAMASVGSLARQAAQRQRQQHGGAEGADGGGGNEEDEVQRALTSAAAALEKALEDVSQAVSTMARGDSAHADTCTDLPAALPGPSTAPDLSGLLAPPAPPTAATTDAGQPEDGDGAPSRVSARGAADAARCARVGTSAGPTSSNSALASPDGDITITPTAATQPTAAAADPAGLDTQEPSPATRSAVPPGFDLQLNATAAVLVPTADTNPTACTSPDVEPNAPPASAEPAAYKYDKPAAPATPTGASGLSGVADWAWSDPNMEAPAAPGDGSLAPNSAAAGPLGDPIIAAAAAMPSVIRAAADPASWDLGRRSSGGGGDGGGGAASAGGGRAGGGGAALRVSTSTRSGCGDGRGRSATSAGGVGDGGKAAAAGLRVNTSNRARGGAAGIGIGSTVSSPRSPGLGSWSPTARSGSSSGGSPRMYNPFGAVSSRSLGDAHGQEDDDDDGSAVCRRATYSGTGSTAAAGAGGVVGGVGSVVDGVGGVVGGVGSVVDGVMEPAEVAALLPDVPGDLEVAAQGPGLEGTAEVTRVAVAAIAAPRYITPLPPHLIDIAREPSAWDLAGP